MLGDAKVAAQQGLRRGGAEANNYFRMECGDLGVEPRPAGGYFCGIWFFVDAAFSSRFPLEVFYRVGDANLFAANACLRESLVEKAAGRPDKRFAFSIFLIAGLFADKDNFRAGQTFTEHGLRGVLPQIAGLVFCRRLQFFQRCIGLDRWLSGLWRPFWHRLSTHSHSSKDPEYIPGCLRSKSNPLAMEFSGEVDNLQQGVENWGRRRKGE